MSTTIMWIAERQDHTGKWHAVCDRTQVLDALREVPKTKGHPLEPLLANRNYPLFNILSDLYAPKGQDDYRGISSRGQPKDLSGFSQVMHGRSSDLGGYHHHGYLTLQDLQEAFGPNSARQLSDDQKSTLRTWHASWVHLAQESELVDVSTILCLGSESAHEQMRNLKVQAMWTQPEASQLRIVFCFES